jgi:hypothetical protein
VNGGTQVPDKMTKEALKRLRDLLDDHQADDEAAPPAELEHADPLCHLGK